eukprot:TRINITY_DN1002_c7_g1_i1.p1 TRINITY_DN1002_c7_g1~~TRINITY_DN1002_c7_g1_i1.p1  ORF type:complete len:119 (+),score=30.24 TRINITY_DN1002_c7_g1_i1:350-706(+)
MAKIAENFSQYVVHHKVYVSEAHPVDGWAMYADIDYKQPKTLDERLALACNVKKLLADDDLVVDNMDNEAEMKYSAHPERLYVIDQNRKIVYKSGMGPEGYKPKELASWLWEYCFIEN